MVKCPACPKKFATHHGLGGHLSGPCGFEPRPRKEGSSPKPSVKPGVVVDLGEKRSAELHARDQAKAQAAIPSRLASDLRKLAALHLEKAAELERIAKRVEVIGT